MSKLAKALANAKIDDIVDDEKFVETENEFIREYCIKRNFNISDEDMNEIRNRGLENEFDYWKDEFGNEKEI